MAIDDILKRIDEETGTAIQNKLDEARRKAEVVEGEYAVRAETLEAELRLRAEKRSREEERRLIVSEQLEIRKALLARKRKVLEALYEKALRLIEELPRDRYRSIVKSLVIGRAISGAEEILVASRHRDLFGDTFLAELNESYPGGGTFTIAAEAGDFGWGVVLREGRRVVDLTLEALFEQLCERIEPEIAAVMFPTEKGRGKD
jgi:V/A-type H+-transporting ATPase subunit E